MEIPLGFGQSMWQPKLEARVLQELQIQRDETVLEIGTGSGYLTALLSTLANTVTSVEIIPELSNQAKARLARHPRNNITLEIGDGADGWGNNKYDVIIMTGSMPVMPDHIQESLNEGGRLFCIVGEAPLMHAQITTRVGRHSFETHTLFETCVAPLQNVKQPSRFEF